MKALVIQFRATALPPRSRPMAGVATAPPEKLSGRTRAARHTATRIGILPFSGVAIFMSRHASRAIGRRWPGSIHRLAFKGVAGDAMAKKQLKIPLIKE